MVASIETCLRKREKRYGKTWELVYLNAGLETHPEDKIFLCQLGYVILNMVINNTDISDEEGQLWRQDMVY